MYFTGPLRTTGVLVVANLPPDIHRFRCNFMKETNKGVQCTLPNSTMLIVYERGCNMINYFYPGSECGIYCKIKGRASELLLESLIKFLKLYGDENPPEISAKITRLKKLEEGLTCESIGDLIRVLTNALATKRWKPEELIKFTPSCQGNYLERQRSYEQVLQDTWKKVR